jgi:hypothetical protein
MAKILNKLLLTSGATVSTSLTSDPLQLDGNTEYSIQAVYAGGSSPTGTLKLQVSNDNSTFTDLDGSSVAITATGDHLWSVTGANYGWVRLVYTRSSGTITLTVRGVIKETF